MITPARRALCCAVFLIAGPALAESPAAAAPARESLAAARSLMEAGQPGEAAVLLQRLLAADPDDKEARRALADALLAMDADGAVLALPLAGAEPTWWRWLLPQVGRSGWLAVEAGRDSNINSATDRTVIEVPYLNYRSLTLSPVLTAQPSSFLGANGGIELAYPYSPTLEFRARGLAAIRYNARQVGYLPHGYHFQAEVEKRFGAVGLGLSAAATQRWVAGYQLLARSGMGARLSAFLGNGLLLSATSDWSRNRYPFFGNIETKEESQGLGLGLLPYGVQLSFRQGREAADGPTKDLDRHFHGYTLDWSRPVGSRGRIEARYAESRHAYDAFSTLFLTGRLDKTRELFVAYEHRLGEDWYVSPKYIRERNDTAIQLLQFDRTQWLVELRRTF